ncbi:MAG TPA: hypothetical protein VGJ53_02795 [Micromonosporaceae bacterium]
MQDAWRAYLELALGLTEASKKRAQKVAKQLAGKGGATAAQLQALAEDLVSTSHANREALTKLVRFEVDRALGAVGLASADEVSDLTGRVRELEQKLRDAEARAAAAEAIAGAPTPGGVTETGPVGAEAVKAVSPTTASAAPKRAVPKKAAAKKTTAKKAVAKKPATAAKRTTATKTPTTIPEAGA